MYRPASMKPFCSHTSISVIICARDPERIPCADTLEKLRQKSLPLSQWELRCQQANMAAHSDAAKSIWNNYQGSFLWNVTMRSCSPS